MSWSYKASLLCLSFALDSLNLHLDVSEPEVSLNWSLCIAPKCTVYKCKIPTLTLTAGLTAIHICKHMQISCKQWSADSSNFYCQRTVLACLQRLPSVVLTLRNDSTKCKCMRNELNNFILKLLQHVYFLS